MKSLSIVVVALALIQAVHGGLLDDAIHKVIVGLNLTDMVLPDLNVPVNTSGIVLNLTSSNLTTQYLGEFTDYEDTSLLPLKVNNLTFTWAELNFVGLYTLNGDINLDILQGPISIHGDGSVSIGLKNVAVSVGFSIKSNNTVLSVKEMTLSTVSLDESEIKLTNLIDNGDLDHVVNVFLGFFLPQVIQDQGDAIMKYIEPYMIEVIDKLLATIHLT